MKRKSIVKKKNFILILGILISAAFPLGVVATVLGAVNENTPIMVLGLVGLILSFFAIPFVWIAFGGLVTKSKIWYSIVKRGITDVNTLANIFNLQPQAVTNVIKNLISKNYLDYTLLYKKIESEIKQTNIKCFNCGAVLKENENEYFCEYCFSKFKKTQY
ncbi:MAG: hypothetical protein IJW13_05180 [Clostridia bacterium]|nr:hypothetical protein [Clostridia bacterium]